MDNKFKVRKYTDLSTEEKFEMNDIISLYRVKKHKSIYCSGDRLIDSTSYETGTCVRCGEDPLIKGKCKQPKELIMKQLLSPNAPRSASQNENINLDIAVKAGIIELINDADYVAIWTQGGMSIDEPISCMGCDGTAPQHPDQWFDSNFIIHEDQNCVFHMFQLLVTMFENTNADDENLEHQTKPLTNPKKL